MSSYMEMIYLDNAGGARKTGVCAAMKTNAETLKAFRRLKRLHTENPRFLCDYFNAKGDLSGTVGLSANDYERVSGEKVKTDKQYIRIDRNYWQSVRRINAVLTKKKPPTTGGNHDR